MRKDVFTIVVVTFLPVLLFLAGCGMVPAKYSYEILENKRIIESWRSISGVGPIYHPEKYGYNLTDGSMNVFVYSYDRAHDVRAYDDEYREMIFFQIDPKLDTFSFEDEKLGRARCYMYISYFGPDTGTYEVNKGRIVGERISPSEYKISVDISVRISERTYKRKFNRVFKQEVAFDGKADTN